ncbi:hypothetical protein KDAU_08570 [Dictyobacter aurantiacus]|uniref:Uncharacterized protein n=1 Tax=Dictyobacter aurantiacus TaxID=1936993 RepID=A0A401Z9P3_9CHLR|nr:hypothetical protein KDAU_08570 [Dictyobacter aurantiacus]
MHSLDVDLRSRDPDGISSRVHLVNDRVKGNGRRIIGHTEQLALWIGRGLDDTWHNREELLQAGCSLRAILVEDGEVHPQKLRGPRNAGGG